VARRDSREPFLFGPVGGRAPSGIEGKPKSVQVDQEAPALRHPALGGPVPTFFFNMILASFRVHGLEVTNL